jgi:hypothetical protein
LIVTDNFTMSYNGSAMRSGTTLSTTLNSMKRSTAATRAWSAYLTNSGKIPPAMLPSVELTGGVYVQSMPSNVKMLFRTNRRRCARLLK